MEKKNRIIYKLGLFGRCPICKEVKQEKCKYCGETDFFSDSSKPGYILCSSCNTHVKIECENKGCNFHIKSLRTPKTNDELERILQYINHKADEGGNRRDYVIKENKTKRILKEIDVPIETSKVKAVIDKEKVKEQKKIEIENKEKINLEKNEITEEPKTEKEIKEAKELEMIQQFWSKERDKRDSLKDEKTTELKQNERRIVNEFYDEKENDELDTRVQFNTEFIETAFVDCHICGKKETEIVCDKCGKSNEFSLDYDALSCKCGNSIKSVTCSCGVRHGHSEFYLVSDGIKWQYSKSKSYYKFRKGRLLVFSTCPSCKAISTENCSQCGSKVNFGKPNSKNEVYCKNCGTVNRFTCSNRKCNNDVKDLRNPKSIEEKLELLNKVRTFKETILKKKEEKRKKDNANNKNKSSFISASGTTSSIYTSSFLEELDKKHKEIITNSFVNEIQQRVIDRKKHNEDIVNHNQKRLEVLYASDKSKKRVVSIILSIVVILFIASILYVSIYTDILKP